jgi:hypothetical protein
MLTIFALPKPFKGHFGIIQRNAISQWARLQPRPEIILFGNEHGTAEIAQELSLRHVPNVQCNEHGTPLLSDLFENAQALASCNTLCYVNADVILMGDFMRAVQRVATWSGRFLMVGVRRDVDLDEPTIYESPDQEARLRALVVQQNKPTNPWAIDYFVFPRGLFPNFPPFAIGRPGWDNWLLWKARASKVALVDATAAVFAIHQNHDYSHHHGGWQGVRQGEEAKRNRELAGLNLRTIEDATHRITTSGIKYSFGHLLMPAKRVVLPWWLTFLRITAPIRHPIGLRQEKIASVLGRKKLFTTRQP